MIGRRILFCLCPKGAVSLDPGHYEHWDSYGIIML